MHRATVLQCQNTVHDDLAPGVARSSWPHLGCGVLPACFKTPAIALHACSPG